MSKRLIIVAGLLAVSVAAAGYAWQAAKPTSELVWQGWVEGDFLFIGADEAGRLTRLDTAEGRTVAGGEPLFSVEDDIQEQERQQAAAQLDESKARLARLVAAQQRPEEIEVLEQQRTRAAAAIEQSRPELARAEELVKRGFTPQARLDQARAAYNRDEATLAEVEKQIAVARLQSRREDIEAAQKVVDQAEARLAAAETRRRRRDVAAPAAGHVQDVFYRVGEVVPAGRPVVSLLPPGNLKLRFFVPQSQLPRLAPGQAVGIRCDGCARDLTARVTFLSAETEFTPPVIFSEAERQKLVFRVEALPEKPELLRVGQPVSVVLKVGPGKETADVRR